MKRRFEEEQYRTDALLFSEAQQSIGVGGRDYFAAMAASQNISAPHPHTNRSAIEYPMHPLQPTLLHPIRTGYTHGGK